jgi:hypothetical protein
MAADRRIWSWPSNAPSNMSNKCTTNHFTRETDRVRVGAHVAQRLMLRQPFPNFKDRSGGPTSRPLANRPTDRPRGGLNFVSLASASGEGGRLIGAASMNGEMKAGASAAEQAERKRERARRLEQEADNWDRGAAGERQIANVLLHLPPPFVVFHDLRLPAPSKANVDHLVVGPNGIWAIDTKNFSHPVTMGRGKGADTLWNGRYPMRKELTACEWEAAAVSDLIGHPVDPMMTIIAPSLPSPCFEFNGVQICRPAMLVDQLRRLVRQPVDVAAARAAIEHAFHVKALTTGQPVPPQTTKQRRTRSPSRGPSSVRAFVGQAAANPLLRFVALSVALIVGAPLVLGLVTSLGREAGERVADNLPTAPAATPPAPTTSLASAQSTSQPPPTEPSTPSAPPLQLDPPPPVPFTVTCPVAGLGWELQWEWPGPLPPPAVAYAIKPTTSDGTISHHFLWSDPANPPVGIVISNDAPTVIITEYVAADGRTLSTVEAPFEPMVWC